MPEEDAKTQDAKPQGSQGGGSRKQTLIMIGAVAAIMALEAGVIFLAVKFFGGGPAPVEAVGLVEGTSAGLSDETEMLVVKFKAPNMKSGKTFLYDMEVYVRVKNDKLEQLKNVLETYKATIEDRLNRVVRSAEPEDLREDGLQTLRRQIKHELGQIIGDEKIIEEVLIPRCTPFRVGY